MPNSAGVEVARISVKVSPDTRKFRRELKDDLEKIEKELSADIEVGADLKAAQAKADFKRLMLQLKAEAARGVNIPVDINVDKDGKGGFLSKLFGKKGGLKNELSDIGDEAEQTTTKVLSMGQGFLGMSRMAWIGVGVLALAAPAVGLVAGILAGLPSLMAAFGAGAGVVALGMDGIKKAAETITPVLDGVKSQVSAVFQQGLTPVMGQLGTMLQTITPGLKDVAGSLVFMAQGVTDVVTKGVGLEQINNILGKTSEFFKGLTPVIAIGTQSFLTLANAGANAFGTLLGPLQTFATQFNAMVDRITSNGAFQGAMQGMAQVLGSVLNLFTRLFESGVQAMGQLGGPLSTLINGLGDAFIALMPALTSLSSLLGNVLGTALSQLAPIITSLTPAFTTLANTLGTLLVGNLQSLGPILNMVAGFLGGAIKSALDAIQPMLPGLIQSFAQLSQTLVTQLGPMLPQLATAFGQLVGSVVQLAPMIISQLVPAFIQLVPKIAEMVPAITQMVQSFANMMPVILPLASALLSVAGAVIQVGVSIGGALIGALANLMGIVSNVISKVSEWVASFTNGAQTIAAKAAELPGMVQSALANLMQIGLDAGKNLVQGLINGIGSMVSAAVAKAKSLASSVAGAVTDFLGIHSPSRLFEEFGINTGQGYAIGLDKGFAPVLEQAKQLSAQVAAAVASGTEDPTALLQGFSKTDVSRMEKVLGTEIKKYERQAKALDLQAKSTGNESLKAEAQKLRDMKEQLQTQKDMLDLAGDFNDETTSGNGAGSLESQVAKLMASPVDFAKATGKQFLSDIGISGEGFISKALTEGTKYIFNIGSVDEALDIKSRQESNDLLKVVGRT
ncbi:tail length tape measure protein [Mycobacterium phage EvilGenius]|uniref:Tape measure protein n=1 Tax=Mycobacterium phage EvilGenius TaxID=1821723 RepID=A0A143FQG0_9CAUD|nr:tail length tape measure protein [Mycobacterium phage EvilGenius]AMW64105.1 tape measure protein [Mycobacterium phage EvilGenius]AMW64284.1 tape measure protein [Mycobacterium phage ChipMunk]QKY78818.1 tape measure protein [Mycobacterium phage KingCyrus]